EPAGLAGARKRAREHERERPPRQAVAQGLGLPATLGNERHVGAARVLPPPGPPGLTLGDQPDPLSARPRSKVSRRSGATLALVANDGGGKGSVTLRPRRPLAYARGGPGGRRRRSRGARRGSAARAGAAANT